MDFEPGQGVIFYDMPANLYNTEILDCFRQMRMEVLIRLKSGTPVWIYFPETHQFAGYYGFLHVIVEKVVLDQGISNHLKWKVSNRIKGESPIYSADFTKAMVHKLRAPGRLGKILIKNPEYLWPRSSKAATP